MALSVLTAVLMAGSAACGNPLSSDDKSASSASSPAPRVSVETEEPAGDSVEIQPYLEEKGFVVSAIRTNYAYVLFLSLEGKGVRLCGIRMAHENTERSSDSSYSGPVRIESTKTQVGLQPVLYLSGWMGDPREEFGERLVVRLDEVTPELIKQKFDLSRCKA